MAKKNVEFTDISPDISPAAPKGATVYKTYENSNSHVDAVNTHMHTLFFLLPTFSPLSVRSSILHACPGFRYVIQLFFCFFLYTPI